MRDLEQLIDWPHVMKQPRYAGGHEEVMRGVFGEGSEVLAWWHKQDYAGTVAIAHGLSDGRVVVMTDYYGSCSGCDAWENADDENARKQILDLVHHAKVFATVEKAAEWCANVDPKTEPSEYPFEVAVHLVAQLLARRGFHAKG